MGVKVNRQLLLHWVVFYEKIIDLSLFLSFKI